MSGFYSIEQCIKATELYKAGKPYAEISKQTGIAHGSLGYCIKKIAGKRGLSRGRGGERTPGKTNSTPVGATNDNPYPSKSQPVAGGSNDHHNFKQVVKTIIRSNMGDTMKLIVIDELLGA